MVVVAAIYMLIHNGKPFYVGQTTRRLRGRLLVHLSEAKYGRIDSQKNKYIQSINPADIEIHRIETVMAQKEDVSRIEEYWAHQFYAWGFPITNENLFPKMNKKSNGSEWAKEKGYTHVAIPKELMDRIKENKKQTGQSISFFVRDAIEAKFDLMRNSNAEASKE